MHIIQGNELEIKSVELSIEEFVFLWLSTARSMETASE